MSTVLLNGSPKGNSEKSASYFLAKAFVRDMEQPCAIRSLATEDTTSLLEELRHFDHVILFAPNYIHALPGIVFEFLEQLPPADHPQSFGLIVQSGYPESAESETICAYFAALMKHLGYGLLGTVIKGECAGIPMMPGMFEKLAARFAAFGRAYEQSGTFPEAFVKEFGEPYMLSKANRRMLNILDKFGVTKMFWHKIQKQHGCYKSRLDRPFQPE